MTIQLAYQQLLVQLYEFYETREAANIADWVIEYVTGQPKIERIMYRDLPVSEAQQTQLIKISAQLLQHRPIQYVLAEAWFSDMKLLVNEHVLIPRPETEELVEWIVKDIKKRGGNKTFLLDIGTGSGCIPIAIKKKVPNAHVSAIDVSTDALQVAKENAESQQVKINFIQLDFLQESDWNRLSKYDIIVSNPPYIRKSEAESMRQNVLQYEPNIALFVPDEDALIFYEAIAKFSRQGLQMNGNVYVEINEALAEQVIEVFRKNGFSKILLKKDLQGRDRMVKASLA